VLSKPVTTWQAYGLFDMTLFLTECIAAHVFCSDRNRIQHCR